MTESNAGRQLDFGLAPNTANTGPLRFELSESPIWESATATRGLRHVATCPALGLEAQMARGCPIGDLARKILDQTDTASETPVEVWRLETLCFRARPLSAWARSR